MNQTPAVLSLMLVAAMSQQASPQTARPRVREAGIMVGVLPSGPLDAITDVPGVLVGQVTVIRGENIRTGVTAILPHAGNVFQEKVPGAIFIGNGFGKLMGYSQVYELGEIETPILLTSTLNLPRVADALLDHVLAQPGNERVQSVNPLVGETNDGYLNDIRSRPLGHDDVFAAIRNAKAGPVEEGAVGAGTGTVAFGFKGGIGTASRHIPESLGGYTVGVLVQSNFGGVLTINGAPVGQELGRYYLKSETGQGSSPAPTSSLPAFSSPDGSCMIVVATDAPVDARNLRRMAQRAIMGLARTGSSGSNGSGDYAIAFSASPQVRIRMSAGSSPRGVQVMLLGNEAMSPLFEATIEATEEAIYNSLFKADTITGNGHTVEALPIERTLEILRRHNALSAGH
ncbi:MAG: P1 family peptidase [Acidobacteria bacterium]|nr:P1 family peptidase [Acidobacteriota bacterium]